jgi:hypothetical protein
MSTEKPPEKPPTHEISGAGGIEHGRAFGTPDVSGVARFEWLVDGYLRAHGRFLAALNRRESPEETFIPLFETLNWAASIGD